MKIETYLKKFDLDIDQLNYFFNLSNLVRYPFNHSISGEKFVLKRGWIYFKIFFQDEAIPQINLQAKSLNVIFRFKFEKEGMVIIENMENGEKKTIRYFQKENKNPDVDFLNFLKNNLFWRLEGGGVEELDHFDLDRVFGE